MESLNSNFKAKKSTNLSIAAFYILCQSLKFGKDFFWKNYLAY